MFPALVPRPELANRMEPKLDVLAVLEAKSTQTSLEALAKRGATTVRVISGKDVAWMVQEAVERAFSTTDWVPPEQVEELRRKAEQEFESLARERQDEVAERAELQQELDDLRGNHEVLQKQYAKLRKSRQAQKIEVERARQRIAELEEQLGETGGGRRTAGSAVAPGEMQDLLDKVVGSLDQRIAELGRKMGVSAAVDTAAADFEGLISRTVEDGTDLESNIDTVEVEKRKGAGIASNLERIKKLRRGGG